MTRTRIGLALVCGALNLVLLGPVSAGPTSQPASTQPDGADSPRALLEALQGSYVVMDVEGIARCVPPADRTAIRASYGVIKVFVDREAAVYRVAEEQLGKEVTHSALRPVMRGFGVSPLQFAIVDGKVDWEKIKIVAEDSKATVEVLLNGRWQGNQVLLKLAGRWYLVPIKINPAEIDKVVEKLKAWMPVSALDDFEAKLKAGKVTKDNAREELDKSLSAFAPPPTTGTDEDD